MTAIIEISGKQFKVVSKEKIKVQRINAEEGDIIEYKNVLFVDDGKKVVFGSPYIESGLVKAKVIHKGRTPKVRAGFYKRRKQYRRHWGFREEYTLLEILDIKK